MEKLIETLSCKFAGYGHHRVSFKMDGKEYSAITTMVAVDAAFDDCYDDNDNEGRYYESRQEAQEAVVKEILRANDIEL